MKKIKFAIIGAGIMGDFHSRVISESDYGELVAIAGRTESKAREMAQKYNVPDYYVDYNVMLKNSDIDAVCVTTPDFLHLDPVLACIKNNKHVLVEKPLATSVEEAKLILDSQKEDKVLMVNYTMRWCSAFRNAKNIIDSGEIGKPVMMSCKLNDTINVATEMLNWADKTSPATFLSSHDIDLLMWLFNSDITEVYANGAKDVLKRMGIDTYDAIQACVKFKNGCIGTFETSWITPNRYPMMVDMRKHILGEKGVILLDTQKDQIEVLTENIHQYPTFHVLDMTRGKLEGAFKNAHDHFVDCIINSKKPEPSAEMGYKNAKVIDAIHKSIELRQPIFLE